MDNGNRTIPPTPARPVAAPGDMRVAIAAPMGLKTQPLKHARTGATVHATAYIECIRRLPGGRSTGLVRNNTGTAIFTVGSDFLPRLDSLLQTGAAVTIRGTAARVDRFPTISVTAVQAVA